MSRLVLWLSCVCWLLSCQPEQPSLKVAIASNFVPLFEALQAPFQAETGLSFAISSASSGTLATQIRNGAPFDLYFSADSIFPAQLFAENLGVASPEVFVYGKMALWTKQASLLPELRHRGGQIGDLKIAIAEPELAPYGAAAYDWLVKHQLWDKLEAKLIRGNSVSQVNQFIRSGVVDIAFTAASAKHVGDLGEKGNWEIMEEVLIPHAFLPLKQGEEVIKLIEFLTSDSSVEIINQYGYE